jgi:hypothetical protein
MQMTLNFIAAEMNSLQQTHLKLAASALQQVVQYQDCIAMVHLLQTTTFYT